MEGQCVECGLVFRWGEVFDPMTVAPRWSVEFASNSRWLLAVVATWALSAVRPRLVWRRLKMAMPVQGWRLAAYVVVLLVLPVLVVLLAGQTTRAIRLWNETQSYLATGPRSLLPGLAALGAPGDANWPGRLAVFRRSKVADGGVELVLEIPPSYVGVVERGVADWDRWRASQPVLNCAPAEFGLHQVLLPLSSEPSARIVLSDGSTQPLPSPVNGVLEILESAREIDGTRRVDVEVDIGGAILGRALTDFGLAGGSSALTPVFAAAALIFPPVTCIALWQLVIGAAVFAVLPQTRRKAKVSWAHVGRVTAYGAWIAVLPAVVPLASAYYVSMKIFGFSPTARGAVSFGLFSITSDMGALLVRAASLWAIPALLWIWWSLAAKHYLKLPHAWGVGLAQTVIAAGVTLAIYQVTLFGLPSN